jgi:hypothetical protein
VISNPPANDVPARAPADWNSPKPDSLAKPTWYPAALAFGVTLTTWGLIVSAIVLAMGLAVVILSLSGWIRDIRHERARD